MPSRRLMSCSESITTLAFIGSSEAIGSSARIIFGCCISARAIATRCCWPPDSVPAGWSAACAMPSRSSEAIAEARSSRENMPSRLSVVERWFSRPSSTLVSTSRRGTRLNCWKIMAQSRCQRRSAGPASAETSVWSKKIDPWVGSIRRLIMRRRVDLPAPERPMMPTICPWGISRATRSTAVFLPKRRVTSRICSMAASLSSAAFTAHCANRLNQCHERGMSRRLQFCDSPQGVQVAVPAFRWACAARRT